MNKKNKNLKEIKRGRLWLFRFIIFVLLPLLLVLLLELGLRIGGYGDSTHAFASYKSEGKEYVTDNYRFSWRFFPPKVAREFDPFIFPAEKEETIRVFILGSSPAQGVPDGAYGFGRILEVMLKEAYPGVRFQVVNTAITAVNSFVVREITRHAVQYRPDLFVVYMGNNEVVGPFGPGTVFTPAAANLTFIRLGMWFKTTRIGQLLSNLMGGIGGQKEKQDQWRGLEMFLGNRVSPGDPRLENVYGHFRENLSDIRRMALDSGSGIVFCTPAVNLKDSPPFASLHREDLEGEEKTRWEDLYKKGTRAEEGQQYAAAASHYLEAAKIDHLYADLHFRLARCYQQLKQYDKAKEYYLRARQMDALRFRADETIGQVIRRVAETGKETGESRTNKTYLADVENEFRLNSPFGVPGKELFYEHVHMNFRGNYILARTVFEQVKKELQSRLSAGKLNASPQVPPTEQACARLLAFTPWNQYRTLDTVLNDYLRNPPYSNQLYHDRRVAELEQWLKAMREQLNEVMLSASETSYVRSIQKYPDDLWLRRKYARFLFMVKGDMAAAEQEYRKVLELLPHSYEGPSGIGFVLNRLEKYGEAVAWHRKALARHPYKADVLNNLALAIQNTGDVDSAVAFYRKAMDIRPRYLPPYHNLGLLLKKQGDVSRAEQVFRNGLKMFPASMEMHFNLALILSESKRNAEAIELLRDALRIEPGAEPVRQLLNRLLQNE